MNIMESVSMVANQRAEFAYKCVDNIADEDYKVAQKYKSYSKRIMAMIRINGLLATITYLKASISNQDEGKAYRQLYEDIDSWLKSKECPVNFVYKKEKKELIDTLISLTSDEYRVVAKEIMEFTNWLRRFAEGMIKDDSSAKGN